MLLKQFFNERKKPIGKTMKPGLEIFRRIGVDEPL
jgi:hypothetical protein